MRPSQYARILRSVVAAADAGTSSIGHRLLDLATGMFLSLLALPLFTHDMRGVIGLQSMLQPGDILLGDRAFCSFCHLAMLNARGVFACMRLHQRRKDKPGVSRWKRPADPPAWMDVIRLPAQRQIQ